VVYRTPDELREKVEYYLNDEPARRRIAAAGYERVRREHTYANRLAVILQEMGIERRSAPLSTDVLSPARTSR